MEIKIADYNSAAIKAVAKEIGAKHMELVGEGHSDGNTNNPNSLVSFFRLDDGSLVADTNGDPVWENDSGFHDLATDCGVEL